MQDSECRIKRRYNKIYIVLFLATIIFSKSCFAEEKISINTLYKKTMQLTLTFEEFNVKQDESIGVIGMRLEHVLNSRLSLGPELDGSIFGKRAGYFAIGINVDLLLLNTKFMSMYNRIFLGGGGGGAINQYVGSGMLVKYSGGLIFPISKTISFRTEVGYIKFLRGSISDKLLSGGISYKYYKIKSI